MIVEIFKNWISSMLCIGIFITFIQLIVPKSNLKKYIYSLIGIVTIISILSPIINFSNNESLETSITQVLNNISDTEKTNNIDEEESKKISEENIKKAFIESVKKDVKSKLTSKNIVVESVQILISQEYDIEKLEVKIEKLNEEKSKILSVNEVVKYINSEYDIDFSKIVVIEK